MNRAIAYGDCNTEGLKGECFPLWPQIVCESEALELTNCGHTMSTTRELLEYNRAFPASQYAVAFVHYPDFPLRKLARKLVKKLKKLARVWQLQKRLGAVEQVPLSEYVDNLHQVIVSAPKTRFILVATAPNLDEPRNPRIKVYNEALARIAESHDNVMYVDVYEDIWAHRDLTLMEDGTHLTAAGHERIAAKIISVLKQG